MISNIGAITTERPIITSHIDVDGIKWLTITDELAGSVLVKADHAIGLIADLMLQNLERE